MRLLWTFAGLLSLGLGILGAALPLLPTVPFLLLAAFCFSRSSERLHRWLVEHPVFGPPIKDWQVSGAISVTAKRLATLSIAVVFSISVMAGLKPSLLATQAIVLLCVLGFIWSRPSSGPKRASDTVDPADRGTRR